MFSTHVQRTGAAECGRGLTEWRPVIAFHHPDVEALTVTVARPTGRRRSTAIAYSEEIQP